MSKSLTCWHSLLHKQTVVLAFLKSGNITTIIRFPGVMTRVEEDQVSTSQWILGFHGVRDTRNEWLKLHFTSTVMLAEKLKVTGGCSVKILTAIMHNQSPRMMCASTGFFEEQNGFSLKRTCSGQFNTIPHGILKNFSKFFPTFNLGFCGNQFPRK